nr:F-box/LRR-repeat protein 12 [Pogona vitticeps]
MEKREREARSPPSLSDLPDCLLLMILAWLPPRDRLGGARICRRWNRLVRDKFLWRHVDLTSYKISSKTLWHLLRNHLQGSLRTLKAQGYINSVRKREVFTPALMQALGKQCPSLCHLCLTATDLRSLLYEHIPSSLTTLELSLCEIPSGWFKVPEGSQPLWTYPKIQHLVIRDVPSFSDQHLFNISVQGTLKSLVLSNTYRISDAGIQRASLHLGKLEHLTLQCCSIGDSATHFVGRHMKSLHTLDLGGSFHLTDAGLLCLSSLSLLEDVSLAHCIALSPEAILAFCQALPQLRHLDLSGIKFKDEIIHKIQATLPDSVVDQHGPSINTHGKPYQLVSKVHSRS